MQTINMQISANEKKKEVWFAPPPQHTHFFFLFETRLHLGSCFLWKGEARHVSVGLWGRRDWEFSCQKLIKSSSRDTAHLYQPANTCWSKWGKAGELNSLGRIHFSPKSRSLAALDGGVWVGLLQIFIYVCAPVFYFNIFLYIYFNIYIQNYI